ncbi:hypothetical protein ROZALSC1DRAFT_23558, partial [Rozella allomycis CSF55]
MERQKFVDTLSILSPSIDTSAVYNILKPTLEAEPTSIFWSGLFEFVERSVEKDRIVVELEGKSVESVKIVEEVERQRRELEERAREMEQRMREMESESLQRVEEAVG